MTFPLWLDTQLPQEVSLQSIQQLKRSADSLCDTHSLFSHTIKGNNTNFNHSIRDCQQYEQFSFSLLTTPYTWYHTKPPLPCTTLPYQPAYNAMCRKTPFLVADRSPYLHNMITIIHLKVSLFISYQLRTETRAFKRPCIRHINMSIPRKLRGDANQSAEIMCKFSERKLCQITWPSMVKVDLVQYKYAELNFQLKGYSLSGLVNT